MRLAALMQQSLLCPPLSPHPSTQVVCIPPPGTLCRVGGFGVRPILSDDSTVEELEDEIEWIQNTLIDILNEHCKVVTICARSKRWWNDDIKEKKKTLGRAVSRPRPESRFVTRPNLCGAASTHGGDRGTGPNPGGTQRAGSRGTRRCGPAVGYPR